MQHLLSRQIITWIQNGSGYEVPLTNITLFGVYFVIYSNKIPIGICQQDFIWEFEEHTLPDLLFRVLLEVRCTTVSYLQNTDLTVKGHLENRVLCPFL